MVLQIYVNGACLESWLPGVSFWIVYGEKGMNIYTYGLFGELHNCNDQGLTVMIQNTSTSKDTEPPKRWINTNAISSSSDPDHISFTWIFI